MLGEDDPDEGSWVVWRICDGYDEGPFNLGEENKL